MWKSEQKWMNEMKPYPLNSVRRTKNYPDSRGVHSRATVIYIIHQIPGRRNQTGQWNWCRTGQTGHQELQWTFADSIEGPTVHRLPSYRLSWINNAEDEETGCHPYNLFRSQNTKIKWKERGMLYWWYKMFSGVQSKALLLQRCCRWADTAVPAEAGGVVVPVPAESYQECFI